LFESTPGISWQLDLVDQFRFPIRPVIINGKGESLADSPSRFCNRATLRDRGGGLLYLS
jgi:hypothetical protein